MKYFKATCLSIFSYVSATNNGPVIIKEDGVDVTRYVVSDNAQISTDGRSITLQHNARGHIASEANDELTAENYH